jgi:PAS domain S-box-containing protein
VGTGDGLYYHNATVDRWRFWKHAVSDPHNTVNEILRTRDGAIWLATEGGVEAHRPDGTVTTMDNAAGDRLQVLTGLAEDDRGNVWVSSGAALFGAYRWNGSRWDHFAIGDEPLDTRFHKLRSDREGRTWFLGLGGDLSRNTLNESPGAYVLSNGTFTRWGKAEGLLSGRVYAFAQGPDSALWFGTLGGVSRWKNGRWTYWTQEQGLVFPNVFTLAVDSGGRVWIAGQTSHLGFIQDDSLRYLPSSEFPVRGSIWDLRVDAAGTLWISGRSEIISYGNGQWLVYDASSGLGKFESWPVLPLEHEVYVGTHGNGTAILNLRESRPSAPRITIDKPRVENNSVLLRWRPLAYWGEIPPAEIQSRYSIDGQPWSEWDTRSDLTLEDVAAGEHAVLVQAKGLLGIFGPGAAAEFRIAAPFYQTPKFLIPAGLTAVTIAGLGLTLLLRKRKHAADLRQSELKFRRLTEATFEGIGLHDGGTIIDANQSLLDMFGYGYEEIVGRSVLDLAAPESRELLREMTTTENERPYEAVGLRKDGSLVYLEIIGKMIPYDRRPVSVIAIRDITERKLTEERLLMYQKQLRSLAQELSTTEEHERRQMAAYLHDTIGQALAFCKIKLGQLKDAETSSELREVRKLIEETLRNAQSLTFELSPPILYELSFEEAVEWLCEHHQKGHGIAISFRADAEPREIPDGIRIVLYNAVRELLVNIAKHSGAASASVSIRHGERNLTIIVSDDGRGFAPAKAAAFSSQGGFGLFNIRERLAHLGGKLQINSMPGKGTAVTISLPLHEPLS